MSYADCFSFCEVRRFLASPQLSGLPFLPHSTSKKDSRDMDIRWPEASRLSPR
eukprot:jgi/Botrbrau1/15377/Bobra.43_2s0008.1